MADNSAQIAALEEILNSGSKSVSTDGESVTFDLGEVRRRLAELRRNDISELASGRVRPVNATIKTRYYSS